MRGRTASSFPGSIAACAAFIVATQWFDAARFWQGGDAGSTSVSMESAMLSATDSCWHQAGPVNGTARRSRA